MVVEATGPNGATVFKNCLLVGSREEGRSRLTTL
jgi:hypothetical protein